MADLYTGDAMHRAFPTPAELQPLSLVLSISRAIAF
jgi:hypothetical protein